MAKLSTTLSLIDGFTNNLNKVNSSLQRTSRAFTDFKRVTGIPMPSDVWKGFRSGAQSAGNAVNGLTSAFSAKMAMIAGAVQAVASGALNALSNSIRSMIGGLSSASATWQTFQGNMEMVGKTPAEIASTKKELQDFAAKTIYSASDMASTYSQLEAVGIKSADKLTMGFGGLAAAAANPQQAMTTLSQQATQMAAKPMVQWQDFKLMLEQTPAGISQIAKTMGKSTAQLVKDVQDGTIQTQDFFDAITETGTNAKFTEMATQFKTVGQAMDGLKEGLTNKLQPAFDKASEYGIKVVEKLSASFDKIDFSGLEKWIDGNFPKIINSLGRAFNTAKDAVLGFMKGFGESGALSAVSAAFSSIKEAISGIVEKVSGGKGVGEFGESLGKLGGGAVKLAADVIKGIAGAVARLADGKLDIANIGLIGLVGALVGLKVLKKIMPLINGLKKIFDFGKDKKNPAKPLKSLKEGLNSLQKSAGIALVIASLALLAKAIQPIAKLGKSAVAPLVAFGAVVAGLGVVFALFGSKLQASAVGIGVFLGALALVAFAMQGIANSGQQGMANMITFGLVIGGLALIFALFGGALNAAIPAMLAFGAMVALVGFGLGQAAPFMEALPPIIMALGTAFSMTAIAVGGAISQIISSVSDLVSQIGDSVTQIADAVGTNLVNVVDSVGTNISKVFESIGDVADKIGGGIRMVLDGIANIVEKLGTAALNAGQGFDLLSLGIERVTNLNAGDMANTLVQIASGLGKISENSGGLAEAGDGMMTIATAVSNAASNTMAFVSGLGLISGTASSAIASAEQLQSVFGNLQITPPDMSPVIEVFTLVVSQATALVVPMGAAGLAVSQGFSTALQTGFTEAVGKANTARQLIVSALSGIVGQMYSIGLNIGQGLANGMQASLGAVAAAASALAEQADKAARAKAEVHSPSRVFMETGKFFGQGLAIGMTKSIPDVASAGSGLSEVAITGANVPSQPLHQSVSTTNTTNNQNQQVIFEVGGITIVSSGNEEIDAEKLLGEFEQLLMQKQNAGLAWT